MFMFEKKKKNSKNCPTKVTQFVEYFTYYLLLRV